MQPETFRCFVIHLNWRMRHDSNDIIRYQIASFYQGIIHREADVYNLIVYIYYTLSKMHVCPSPSDLSLDSLLRSSIIIQSRYWAYYFEKYSLRFGLVLSRNKKLLDRGISWHKWEYERMQPGTFQCFVNHFFLDWSGKRESPRYWDTVPLPVFNMIRSQYNIILSNIMIQILVKGILAQKDDDLKITAAFYCKKYGEG